MRKPKPEYDFVPFKFGCYSYSANADMTALVKKGILSETEKKYSKNDQSEYYKELKIGDKNLLEGVISDYGKMSTSTLIKHTYLNFPFYAINSTIAEDVLGSYFQRVVNEVPKERSIVLFTIGYEGISLEKYLLKLVRNNIRVLVDVRRNPLSMKFGFSKSLLKRYCGSLGINYVHLPDVGIASENRRQLNSQDDYDILFTQYRKTTLKETESTQLTILDLLKKKHRIALTCFEAEPCKCHRSHLAESIKALPGFQYDLIHL